MLCRLFCTLNRIIYKLSSKASYTNFKEHISSFFNRLTSFPLYVTTNSSLITRYSDCFLHSKTTLKIAPIRAMPPGMSKTKSFDIDALQMNVTPIAKKEIIKKIKNTFLILFFNFTHSSKIALFILKLYHMRTSPHNIPFIFYKYLFFCYIYPYSFTI